MLNLKNGSMAQVPGSINLPINPNQKPIPPHHLHLLQNCTHLTQFKQIHAQIIKKTLKNKITDTQLAKLIESLVNSSQINYAQQVFDQMSQPSTFAFNTMIKGCIDTGLSDDAIELYVQMRFRDLEPDNYTYPFLLKACSDLHLGKGIHSLIVKNRMFSTNVYSQTCLVHFYCEYGDIESARRVFYRMVERNVVTWTAMITGYVKQKRLNEGLALFDQMLVNGIEINELTLVNVLSACAHLGMYQMGKWVHLYIDQNLIFMNSTLGSALIDMYVKCGYIEEALETYQSLPQKNVCTWNSIIGGLAIHGHGHEAIKKFEAMKESGIKPDDITFIGVLSACSHTGMVEIGKHYFNSMRRDYNLEPKIKHYGCLVDLLCRAGQLKEVYDVIKHMPMKPNGVIWGTLLNACVATANVELAEIAMEQLIELEPFNDGNHVTMSNIYAKKKLWNDVAKMRKVMREKRIVKNPGYSLIEVDNVVYKFLVGDGKHPFSEEIISVLEDLDVSRTEDDLETDMEIVDLFCQKRI